MATRKLTEEDDPAVRIAIASSLMRLHRCYRAAVDQAVSHIGLSLALGMPLLAIGRAGGKVRPGVLADQLGIASPSLIRSLDQLQAAGLVERCDDAVDRRAKTVHLTRAGQAARRRIEDALEEFRGTLFAGVAARDAAACLRVLRHLEARLGRPAEPSEAPAQRKARPG